MASANAARMPLRGDARGDGRLHQPGQGLTRRQAEQGPHGHRVTAGGNQGRGSGGRERCPQTFRRRQRGADQGVDQARGVGVVGGEAGQHEVAHVHVVQSVTSWARRSASRRRHPRVCSTSGVPAMPASSVTAAKAVSARARAGRSRTLTAARKAAGLGARSGLGAYCCWQGLAGGGDGEQAGGDAFGLDLGGSCGMGVPSGGQQEESSQRNDHQRPSSTRKASFTFTLAGGEQADQQGDLAAAGRVTDTPVAEQGVTTVSDSARAATRSSCGTRAVRSSGMSMRRVQATSDLSRVRKTTTRLSVGWKPSRAGSGGDEVAGAGQGDVGGHGFSFKWKWPGRRIPPGHGEGPPPRGRGWRAL